MAFTALLLKPLAGRAQDNSFYERIATLAHGSPMITVGQGHFVMGTARTGQAARGEKGYLFPWGHKPPAIGLAMFGQYHLHEIPIVASVERGEEGRSPYGLHHMAGNAAEWVEDWFGIDYYATMLDRNPCGAGQGRYKVVRGGSWKSAPPLLRTATRSGAAPEQRTATVGFRCAKSIR
ncbi:MAG TPA: SUMF1/EgtB/PvdO family nonheme iron enzyme [Nitrospira sp.]|nr:SUMF1/EgtB/PvdO family nonheme iron enzyme [Nitrospira sp.]